MINMADHLFIAIKALPNPHIIKILKEEGLGADCSSMGGLPN